MTERTFFEVPLKLVNLGCGLHFHQDWINLDKYPMCREVALIESLNRLPFTDSSVDAVYASHVIEHLADDDAQNMLREIFRMMTPGGSLRIVTPDLEMITHIYLEKLQGAMEGKELAAEEYEWMILELFDQSVRERRGGAMADFLRKPDLAIQDFIKSRIGLEVEEYWGRNLTHPSVWTKIRSVSPNLLIQYVRNTLAKALVYVVAGRTSAQAFETGIFRQSGEIHYRLYDRYSLQKIMTGGGFVDIKVCRADESMIPAFNSYGLDIVAGEVRKPDSLFMEGVRP